MKPHLKELLWSVPLAAALTAGAMCGILGIKQISTKQPVEKITEKVSLESRVTKSAPAVEGFANLTFILGRHGSLDDVRPIEQEIIAAEQAGRPYRGIWIEGSMNVVRAETLNYSLRDFSANFDNDKESCKRSIESILNLNKEENFNDVIHEMFAVGIMHKSVPRFIETYNSDSSRILADLSAQKRELFDSLGSASDKEKAAEMYCDSMARLVLYRNSILADRIRMERFELKDRVIVFLGGAHRQVAEKFETEGARIIDAETQKNEFQEVYYSVLMKKGRNPNYSATPEERIGLVRACIDKNYRR